jgi:hypothetical protein
MWPGAIIQIYDFVKAALAGDGSFNVTVVGEKLSPGTHIGSSSLEKSHVISASPCALRSAKALNSSGSDMWLHVFDAASLPSNGTVPSRTPIPVSAGSVNGDTWAGGTLLATGCVLALSSTLSTLTLISTSDGWFDAEVG